MKLWNWYSVVDSKKYTGSDEISAKVLKDTINSIIPCYFYLSIQTSSFPKMCSNCANFQKEIIITRNISYNFSYVTPTQASSAFKRNLSYPSKHLNMYYPISVRQWGYSRGKSPTTALWSVALVCLHSLNNKLSWSRYVQSLMISVRLLIWSHMLPCSKSYPKSTLILTALGWLGHQTRTC